MRDIGWLMMAADPRRWLPKTVRFRITLVAVLAVGLVLTATAASLLVAQHRQLMANLDATLGRRADDLAVAVAGVDDVDAVFASSAQDGFALLTFADGSIIASTPSAREAQTAMLGFPTVELETIRTLDRVVPDDEPFRVLSRRIVTPKGPATIHVGVGVDDVNESIHALATSLGFAIPLVVGILALVVWLLVGRALAPMEAIRTEVELIGDADLHRRVPVPETRDEVERLATTMNGMLGRIEDAVERQQRFVADASHELRSPLTRMRTEIEVDLATSDDLGDRRAFGSILEDVTGMQMLVEDLLFLARSDAGRAEHRVAPVDLDDLVMREANAVRDRGAVRVVTDEVSAADVEGDPIQLARAIRNLFENAERHASRTVVVSLGQRGELAVLRIGNDGPPVPDEHREVIFERFARLDDARARESGGAGLGLAITREIVERHGGTVGAVPGDGAGATFEVVLPMRR